MKHLMVFAAVIAFLFCHVTDLNAQWVKTNGPCGGSGSVGSIAIDSLHVFATSNGCIYRSTDKGNSWSLVYSMNSTNNGFGSLAINSSYIYAGTGIYESGYGIFRSSDNGTSWSPDTTSNPTPSPFMIYGLAVCDSVVLASSAYGAGAAGMFRSTDNGASWTNVRPSGVACYAIQDSEVFAAVANPSNDPYGVYVSNDLGATWTATSFPTIRAYSVAVHGSNVFARTDSNIYRSTNNGISWNTIMKFEVPSGIYPGEYTIAISPSGSYVYAGTSAGLFRSSDNGATWDSINTGLTSRTVSSLAFFPVGSADSSWIFAGTSGGIFRSTNHGATWKVSGLPNSQSQSMGILRNYVSLASYGSNLLAGSGYPISGEHLANYGSVVFVSSDNGSAWTEADSGLSGMHTELTSLIVNGSDIYAGTYPGGVFLSTNGGISWINSSSGMNNKNVYALASNGLDIFAGTNGGGVNLSTDNGLNWSAVNSGLTDANIKALAMSGSNIFAGTYFTANAFHPIIHNDVFLSSDNGTSWAEIDSQSTSAPTPLITCISADGSNLVIGTGNTIPNRDEITWSPIGGVYRLTFDGAKWNRSDSALFGNYVTSLVSSGPNFFAGTYTGGVFASSNYGISWNAISDGLTDSSVVSLVIHNSNLFVATSSGVWRRPISEITSVPPPNGMLPKNYSLEQNYPNPFNPTTTLQYQLPNAGHVTLKVYDLLGRIVETLVNEVKVAGSYSVSFNGEKLASGVYISRLTAGNYTKTMKMVLMK